jgi:solute carrier family 35 protein E2
MLCLIALKYSSISFVETIKSSSPIFIVILSRLLIGELTGFWTKMSLIPIMVGLGLCSSFEINFSAIGFTATILTNLVEWYVFILKKKFNVVFF